MTEIATGGPTPDGNTPGAVDTGVGADSRNTSDMFGAVFGGDTSGFGRLVRAPRTADISSPRPYGGWFDDAVDALTEAYPAFAQSVSSVVVAHGELTLNVEPSKVADIVRVLRDDPNLRFELLSSLSGVDYPARTERLHVA